MLQATMWGSFKILLNKNMRYENLTPYRESLNLWNNETNLHEQYLNVDVLNFTALRSKKITRKGIMWGM